MTLVNTEFLGTTPDSNHFMVINSRPKHRLIFLDLATNRELVFVNEEPHAARLISHARAERSFNLALQGMSGYEFDNFTSDEYEKFNEVYDSLLLN